MKLKKLSGAVGAACLAMSGTSAFALDASLYGNGSTTANIYISGASAQDNGVLTFALQECVSGSVHRYRIANNFVHFCTPVAALDVGQSQMAVYKYSVGGSGNGIAPVNNGVTLPFLDLSVIATACPAVTTTVTFGTLTQPYFDTVCTSTSITSGAVPKLGLSDVEPAFFASASDTGNLTTEALSTLIFGVPVTRNIYLALQDQQGLRVGACTNTSTGVASAPTPVWEYSNECMPSLTRSQIVSAYTVRNLTWAGIGVVGTVANPAPANGAGAAGSGFVFVARRVNSSGTQKTFEALIARTPNGDGTLKTCIPGTNVFLNPSSGDVTNGDAAGSCQGGTFGTLRRIFAGSGGGDVRTCLINHNAGNRGAIGILTAEDIAAPANNWRFVKVDGGTSADRGAAPTHADVAAGRYQFWTVSALNYLPTTATSAPYQNFLTRFKFEFADPVGLAIAQPFGASGLMALYATQSSPSRDFTGASGVNPWDRLVGGTAVDNCQMGKAAGF